MSVPFGKNVVRALFKWDPLFNLFPGLAELLGDNNRVHCGGGGGGGGVDDGSNGGSSSQFRPAHKLESIYLFISVAFRCVRLYLWRPQARGRREQGGYGCGFVEPKVNRVCAKARAKECAAGRGTGRA